MKHIPSTQELSFKRALTFQEGCIYCDYSESHMRKLILANRIPYHNPTGGKIMFDRLKLDAWLLGDTSETPKEKREMTANNFISNAG
jgi:hypothetical protein